jgi:AraC-like DNA-binding protein
LQLRLILNYKSRAMPDSLSTATSLAIPACGAFGELNRDGFRITRWNHEGRGDRHWFHPGVLVLCLNLSGKGKFHSGDVPPCVVEEGSELLFATPLRRSHLERGAGGRHRFIILEMRRRWIARWLPAGAKGLREPARRFLAEETLECEARPMSRLVGSIAAGLMEPPREPGAWTCWHHAKALELVAHALFDAGREELFCERTKRVARERVTRVREILRGDLENPPALAELGRQVGCSPFYLSRLFRQETGETISAFLRRARMDRAAELLRAGAANVTEAAMTVGYSSLSHFSKAFAETFGCCPCLYGKKL